MLSQWVELTEKPLENFPSPCIQEARFQSVILQSKIRLDKEEKNKLYTK